MRIGDFCDGLGSEQRCVQQAWAGAVKMSKPEMQIKEWKLWQNALQGRDYSHSALEGKAVVSLLTSDVWGLTAGTQEVRTLQARSMSHLCSAVLDACKSFLIVGSASFGMEYGCSCQTVTALSLGAWETWLETGTLRGVKLRNLNTFSEMGSRQENWE